jgi:hypothetical protein
MKRDFRHHHDARGDAGDALCCAALKKEAFLFRREMQPDAARNIFWVVTSNRSSRSNNKRSF